jgi:hypothetical protein
MSQVVSSETATSTVIPRLLYADGLLCQPEITFIIIDLLAIKGRKGESTSGGRVHIQVKTGRMSNILNEFHLEISLQSAIIRLLSC